MMNGGSMMSEKGNRPNEYDTQTLDTENEQVRMWRARLRRHETLLDIAGAIERVEKGDSYLDGSTETKNTQRIYCRYLLPLLEELNRKTFPSVPLPKVEAKNQQGEAYEDKIRQLLQLVMTRPDCMVEHSARAQIWDDSRWGRAIGKTEWDIEKSPAEEDLTYDESQLAVEVERAQAENLNISIAQVTEADNDKVHASVHSELMGQMMPTDPDYALAERHLADHLARMIEITAEKPILRRVKPECFVWDTDVPWHLRTWEAERRSVKIGTLIAKRYRNVNPTNLPAETKEEETSDTPYEDKTAAIWDIHDRSSNKHFVISADGNQNGYFLNKGDWMYGDIDVYVPLVFRPWQPDELTGIPTIDAAIPILDRLAETDFHIDRHVKNHANYKTLYPAGAIDNATKSAIKDPNQQFVPVPPEAMNGIKEYAPPPIPDTLLQQRETLLGELRRVVGLDAQDVAAPNPHQTTASESMRRAAMADDRIANRQEIMGEYLSKVAQNFLRLYKRFAQHSISVRVTNEQGRPFEEIDPSQIPDSLDVMLDVKAESDDARALDLQMATEYVTFLQNVAPFMPIDWQKVSEFLGRKMNISRPEQFRLDVPQAGAYTQPTGTQSAQSFQQPGMMGAGQAPQQMPQQPPMQPQAA